ncbi:MAG TPA: RIP metalloprotease RseP [Steroidobacteraceae bacterium]|nr:RIP metalloprotease RseP [Steroidobacteraceae bacterium]
MTPVIVSILAFVIAISVLVAVHEFGHFWVARRLGFKVLRFSIGFGRPLWKRSVGPDPTEYVIAAIPLGGYVKLLDEREGPVAPHELARSFTRRPIWQRLLVLAAGPTFNFLFAILAYWALFMWGVPQSLPVIGNVTADSYAARAGLHSGDVVLRVGSERTPDPKAVIFALLEDLLDDGATTLRVRSVSGDERELALNVASAAERHGLTEPGALLTGLGFDFSPPPVPPVVDQALKGSPAAQAGIESGDRILAVDGVETPSGNALVEYVKARPGERVMLTVRRDDVERTVPVTIRAEQQDGASIGRIGVELRRVELQRLGPVAALGRAGAETWEMSQLTVTMLWNMVMGRVSVKNISGPINIAAFAGETARVGLRPFLTFLAIVSISLGVLNLLPIPILDGGQMVFQLIEWAKGSPLSERAQALGQQVGIALLLLLMSLAFYNDISSRFLN